MKLVRRDVGTGMDDSEVDELSLTIDLKALRGYWDAVTRRTLAVVETLRGQDLEALVPMERVRRVAFEEGRWRRRPRGSPTSGAAAGAASGSCPRHRSCTSTGITSRRGWSEGSGASGAREAHPEDPGESARQEVDDRREPAAPCFR